MNTNKRHTESPYASLFQTREEVDLPGVFPLFCARSKKNIWVDANGTPTQAISTDALINVSPGPGRTALYVDRKADPC